MAFRSHLGRSMDHRRRSNLLLILVMIVSGGVALVLWLNGGAGSLFLAPVYVFLIWALLREIDPDHDWTALTGGVATAAWVLLGNEVVTGFALMGLVVATRIITSTTGRRPLVTDLAVVAVLGIGIGVTVAGWAAGFGIAVAIYLDDRFRGENRGQSIAAATVTAVGTTIVATATGAFPETVPEVVQYLAIASGVVALALLVREPATPTSQVDARHAAFIDRARLHVSRSVAGVLVFGIVLLTGVDAPDTTVVIVALALAVISNEVELLRRRAR